MVWIKEITLKVTVEDVYPIGAIYFNTSSIDPHAILGIGVWELLASGKLKIGSKNVDVWMWQRTG